MTLYVADPLLIRVRQDQMIRASMAAPMALDCAGWQIDFVDDESLLPAASNETLLCEMVWCDDQGTQVDQENATHLAILIAARNDELLKDCAFAQQSIRGMLTAVLADLH